MYLKKYLAMAALVCMMSVSAEAAQINTVIDTGSGMFAEPEKVYSEIDKAVKGWFPTKAGHTFVPTSDSDAIVQIYREEKGSTANSDAMIAGTQARDVSMTKDDLAHLSSELGSDYIMYFPVTNAVPTVSVGFMSAGQKTNVTTDFRIWDAKAGKYAFVKRYQTTGSSSSFYMGMGSASNAVKNGLEKALKQISADKAKIVAAVQ